MKQTLSARQREVARMLLTRTDPVTVAALADRFGVSARTMRYDLDALTEWFDERQLSLVKKPRYGVEVAGSGDAKREALSPRPPKVRIAGGKPGFKASALKIPANIRGCAKGCLLARKRT